MANATGSKTSYLNIPRRDARKPTVVPVGLNFGPTKLSITFFINESDYYTGVPCCEVYKSFFQDTLSKQVQCRPSERLSTPTISLFTSHGDTTKLVETISEHIKSAIGMGVWALDYNPALDFQLMAVTVPDHWGESARTHVAVACKLAGYPLDGYHMIIPLSRAVQLNFQMSRWTEGKYLTLLLDYNKSYLHLILVEMCGTECIMKGQVYLPHLGEDELHKAPDVTIDDESTSMPSTNSSATSDLIFPIGDVHNTYPSDMDPFTGQRTMSEHYTPNSPTTEASLIGFPTSGRSKENRTAVPDEFMTSRPICHNQAAHFEPILDTVSEFMVEMTAPGLPKPAPKLATPRYSVREIRHAVRHVKYIVIDGEASIPGLWDLSEAIKSKFANEEWIQIEGNKRTCGAYGAVLAARQQVQNPKHLDDWRGLPGYVPGRSP